MEMLSYSSRQQGHEQGPAHAVARGLGWFSIGLGLAECMMPQTLARAVGLQGKDDLVRAFGVREIVNGLGILVSRDPEPWVWGRVAGDAFDLGSLTAGLRRENPNQVGTAAAMLVVAQALAVDFACAKALARERVRTAGDCVCFDYSDRGGFARPAAEMRGVALKDFQTPREYRIPEALRSWELGD